MRFYVSGNWGWGVIWGLEGSVFPRAMVIALPNAIIALLLSLHIDPATADEALADNARNLLGGFTGVLFFVLYFRSNVAYSRWWEGGTLLQQTRGEWFNAYSSLIAFSTTDPKMADKVEAFHHMLARLVSLLLSAALQQVSPDRETPFEILDTCGLEPESLRFLSESSDKVEVLLQWIQRSTILNMSTGVLPIPPPVMSRAFQEISRGIVNLQNARKIADFPFPFPYAQTSVIMLLIHWAMCPILASMLLNPILATALCFCLVFFVWCINFIALQLEFPFGHGENDLPMQQFQSDWNKSVGTLLARRAQMPPRFEFDASVHRRLETVMSDGNKPKIRSTLPSHWLLELDGVSRFTNRNSSASSKSQLAEAVRRSRGSTPGPGSSKRRSSKELPDQNIGRRSVKVNTSEDEEKAMTPVVVETREKKEPESMNTTVSEPSMKASASEASNLAVKKIGSVKHLASMDTTAGLSSWRLSTQTDDDDPGERPSRSNEEPQAQGSSVVGSGEERSRSPGARSPGAQSPGAQSPGSQSPGPSSRSPNPPLQRHPADEAASPPSPERQAATGTWTPLHALASRLSRVSMASGAARYEPSQSGSLRPRTSIESLSEADEMEARGSSALRHKSAIIRAAEFTNAGRSSDAAASGEQPLRL